MRESDLVATMTVYYASDGEGAVVAGANAVGAAQDKAAASANALASATENAAKRQISAASQFEALSRRMDPAVRAYADLQKNQTAYANALANNSSITDRAGQGLDVYRDKINAQRSAVEALIRQQEILASQQRAAANIPVRAQDAINKSFSIDQVAPPSSAKASASAFFSQGDIQAEIKATADMEAAITRLRTSMNPLEAEQARLAAGLAPLKMALDAGRISAAEYAAEQERVGRILAASAEKFDPARAAQDAMVASVARLRAEMNPFEAEQGRLGAQMAEYKAALDAGRISQDVYAAETQKAAQALTVYGEKLNTAALAAENLRRQQSNLTTDTSSGNRTVNVSPNMAVLPPSPVNNAFEAEQGRLAERLTAYKSALDAGRISQQAFDAEQLKAGQILKDYGEWLNTTTRSVESLRNQTLKLSTTTSPLQPSTNPTQITGAQLSSVNTKEYAAQTEAAAKAQDDLVASATRLKAALDPLGVEEQRVAEKLGVLREALAATMITQGQFDAAVAAENQGLATLAERLKAADVATEHMRRQQANASVNQGAGFNPASANTTTYEAQFEAAVKAAKAQDDLVAASMRLKAALNPLAAEEAKQVEWLGLMKQAQQAELITAEQFAGAQQMSATRLGNLAQSLKTAGTAGRVMSGEMTNLGFQLNDVVTGLALGQSPFMILAQQGGQIIQIFANSKASIADFASSSMNWFTSLFTVGRAAFGGIAAAIGGVIYANASFISSQRDVTQSLIGIGAKTQTTATQINDFAKQNASATGLSVDQARSLAVEFTKTGNIAVSGLKGVGDAVHGFSILTGQSVDEASKAFAKAFSGDVVSGAEEINKTYGFLNASTRDYIRTLDLQGDRSAAIQVVLDAIAKDSARAADSVSLLTKAYDALTNAASKVKNAIGASTIPQSNEDQLAALEKQKAALEAKQAAGSQGRLTDPSRLITSPLAVLGDIVSPSLSNVNKVLEELKAKIAGVKAEGVIKQFNDWSKAADDVTRTTIPQIAQLEALQKAEMALVLGRRLNDPKADAALTANRNQQAAVQEAMGNAERYNQRVKEISESWGEVSQSTALALQAAQNQLPVIEAVGGAAKMAAQSTADFKNAMDQGKSSTDATALAASNLAASMAQVKAAAQEQLFALQNSLPVSEAWTASAQMRAQQQATYNQLVHQGVAAETAGAVAAAEYADSKAKAVANAEKLVQSSQDNLDKIQAQGTEMEGVVASSIAYRDAIQAGANATQAAAIAANVLQANLLQAAAAADRVAQSAQDAQMALVTKLGGQDAAAFGSYQTDQAFGGSAANAGKQYASSSNPKADFLIRQLQQQQQTGFQSLVDSTFSSSGIDAALAVAKNAPNTVGASAADAGIFARDGYDLTKILGPERSNIGAKISSVDQLYQLKNAQTTDKGMQASNIQQEIGWLNTLPASIERDQKIAALTQSIDQLTSSTNGLNATMGDLLSPYYTQDPRTSHIGFRSQGMASGGSFIVPGGYSSNDNMVGQIPLASGEEVSVRRPGESGTRQINVYQTITIQGGANRDEVRRTQYHNGQSLGRQLRAIGS